MAEVVNGRGIALEMREVVRDKINGLSKNTGRPPRLVSVIAGASHDAMLYVNMQKKAAEFVGIEFITKELPHDVTEAGLVEEMESLNADEEVTSVIVQKPLPEGIDHAHVVYHLDPEKDAEGIHPFNMGKIMRREAEIVPCTPGAVMKILRSLGIDLYGREAVIIGHSAIVGKPLSMMMTNEMATTTVCHAGTAEKGDIKAHTLRADVLVVAVGRPEMVRGDWVKPGAVVVDVGINKVGNKIVGDVSFDEVSEKASAITPVPGGVGPVTVSILMRNVWRSFREQARRKA